MPNPTPYCCPHCKREHFNGVHCGFCGCRATTNPQSGNTVYMVRGRVVAAPDDLRAQKAKHDARYGISGPDPLDLRDSTDGDH